MTNFSSLTEELSQEEFQAQIVNDTENYWALRPTFLGEGYRGERKGYFLKLETPPVPPKPLPKQEDYEYTYLWRKAMNEYHESYSQPRMVLTCDKESMTRFQNEHGFDHYVPKRITTEYNFAEIAEWVHTQTKGGWSVTIFGHKDNRKGKSFLVFYFEHKESAALFKLFNI